MPFTSQELENISNAALDFHMDKGDIHKQSIQGKPLLRRLDAQRRGFPSGKENLTGRAKGDYTTTIQGFTHDDTVTYQNPANIKQYVYPWKEYHAGIQFTGTELKKDGVSVVDSTTGKNTVEHDGREMTALANLLEDKLEDMSEGSARSRNAMYWDDGTQDAKLVPGIRSFIVDDPTAAITVAGIDQQANTWWRNRALLGIVATVANADTQTLIRGMTTEFRQLRRFGGRPTAALCGSDYLDQLEAEMRAKGVFTQDGWAKRGTIDIGAAEASLKGVTFEYDPTLDDLGFAKRAYVLDFNSIKRKPMTGEDGKRHAPARPESKYVYFRAITWTEALICSRRNGNGVYSIA